MSTGRRNRAVRSGRVSRPGAGQTSTEPNTVHLFAEYGASTALWDAAGRGLDPVTLGLSAQLVSELRAWIILFDENYRAIEGWTSADAELRFRVEGDRLLDAVRRELPGWRVVGSG